MTHSPAQIITAFLVAQAVGEAYTSTNWPIFVSSMPDEPDNCICVYDTQGEKQGRQMAGEVVERLGVQVKVRASTYPEGWAKMSAATSALDTIKRTQVTIDASVYEVAVATRASVQPIGAEEGTTKRRELFTVNLLLPIRQLS